VRQFREGRDLKVLHGLFDGYVGAEVLRSVIGDRPKLDGEIRHVAILFCDIRDFSAIAEALRDQPEDLLRLLNEHFEPLVIALKNHGAYVDNYVGDLVMAVFGAPVSNQASDRNTRNAVMAGLEVLKIVTQRNEERRAAGEPVLEVGIGIHCGPAVVGNLGTSRKMHYTAIGDTVNIASRVEGATRFYPTHFLVTEDVVQACRDHPDTARLPWRFVDETQVKGRRAVLRLYTHEEGQAGEMTGDKVN
jgi:adenylate cyclase